MKKIRLVTSIISMVLIIGYAITVAIMWKDIPQTVATHFNARGEADSFGNKSFLLIELLIMTGLFLLLSVVERFPSTWNFPVRVTEGNRGRLMATGAVMLGSLKILMVALFVDTGINSIFAGFPVWPTYVLLVLIAVVIIGGIICIIRVR